MKMVRRLGQEGEDAAGITKNTEHIHSHTKSASYRVPDSITDEFVIEVKNNLNTKLEFDSQIQDYLFYAMEKNKKLVIKAYNPHNISGPLKKAVNEGFVILQDLDGNIIQ